MRLFRRLLWYISRYLDRYRYFIAGSLIVFLLLAFFGRLLWSCLPQSKPKIHLGVVGSYTIQELPPIVDKILSAGLTAIDDQQKIIPNLASSWEISENGKSYLFHLQPNLYWPDQSPITPETINLNIPDVNISFPEPNTIRFSVPEVFAPFPSILIHPIFNSKGQSPTGFTTIVTQNNTGNLKSIKIESNNKIFIIKIFNTNSQALTAFKIGQTDHLIDLSTKPNITPSLHLSVNQETNYRHITTLFFNTKDPTLSDKSIRQALAYALEDKALTYSRAISPLHPSSWAYNPLVKTYNYNPQKSQKLLSEHLPQDKHPLALELATLPEHLQTAENIKHQLEKRDINLDIRVVNSLPENFQLFLGTFIIPLDPDQYSLWHSTQPGNITKIQEVKIDKFLEDGRTTLDPKQRRQIYLDFQKTLLEELPALFLYHPYKYQVSRGNLNF